ncbi:hypothetical protein FNH22_08985 [Fulvivirga sp. M361]|uniref:hypothetical protein n=1 Tax=Fulvivirga sp. M361 TaxID=2594266 RepID=UPI00117B240C|nr:hypothetical protein [Fulvivirga sp. M361]TRX60172.1 hypothetical protein FNH22_08985 [Fulvivirga sp. M361]
MKMKVPFLLILFFISDAVRAQDALWSGLYFSSYEVIKDKRTSLNLTADEAFDLSNGFTLTFDANFRSGDGYYGYVFRMIDTKNNIDLVSNLGADSVNFWLILKDTTLISYQWKDIPNGGFDQWMKVEFHVDPHNAQISLSLNNHKQVKTFDGQLDLSHLNIVFGACNYTSFLNSDVAPMTLKDVRLYDDKQKLYRHWKLYRHGEQNVYDEVAHAPAEVLNPSWLIDRHTQWRHRKRIMFNNLIGVAQNKATGEIFFADDEVLYSYSTDSDKLDTLKYLGGTPFHCLNNHIFYYAYSNELWSYDFNKNYVNRFDFASRKWSESDTSCAEPDLWHHNRFISPYDSSLITFGGYGHYTYKSIFNRFHPQKELWEKLDVSKKISPRYLSGIGFLDKSNVLIFGGYGSKSGRQELSPEFYYDLYTVDIEKLSVDKRWSAKNTSGFVPCNDLLFDSTSGKFLTLLYNSNYFDTSLKLVSFGLDAPEKQVFGDSIPYKFLDTKSWCNLYMNKTKSELIAVTVYNSEMNLYSLACPPLLAREVYQEGNLLNSRSKLWILISLSSITILMLSIFWNRRKKKRTALSSPSQTTPVASYDVAFNSQKPAEDQKRSAFYLFAGFQVFDKSGQVITSHFTPTLKELFLLIFLNSFKNGKGVSSQILNETLWFDKSGDSARNNRNVNMSKLRPLLEGVGCIELSKEGTFWKINLQQELYCDYIEVMYLLKKIQQSTELPVNEIHRVIAIASVGKLLPDVQNEWIDVFKEDFSNLLIEVFLLLAERIYEKEPDYDLLYSMAKCLLKHDSINDEAIAIKCSALYNSGKKGQAKHAYDSFCLEYRNLMGTDFDISFQELLKRLDARWSLLS